MNNASDAPTTYQATSVQSPNFEVGDGDEPAESYQSLSNNLMNGYIQYVETARRCQMQLKNKAASEQYSRLYFTPQVPFLEKPEKQKDYRKSFIADVGRMPEPKPIYLIADKLQHEALEALGDQSDPTATKASLTKYFTRRNA